MQTALLVRLSRAHPSRPPAGARDGRARPHVARCLFSLCLAWPGPGAAGGKARDSIPLPPPRPAGLAAPAPVLPGEAGGDTGCGGAAAEAFFSGDMQPPFTASGGCGIASPVLLRAIVLRNGARVAVVPPALVSCPLASALAQWLREDVAPAMLAHTAQLIRVETAGAYECRGRNRVKDARMSEHATGNALDISAFAGDQGRRFEIASQAATPAFFQSLKQSACARFMTVLGPGSDGFHETHLHLDLQARTNGSHFCQWTIN